MADVTKYQLVPNNNNANNILPEMKGPLSLLRPRKSTTAFVYGVVLAFVVFTVLLAFVPSSSPSNSPWFINIFTVNSTSPPPTYTEESYRSHFSSIFSYFFPNSSQTPQIDSPRSQIITTSQIPTSHNLTKTHVPPDIGQNTTQNFINQTSIIPDKGNQSDITPQISPNITTFQAPTSNNPLPSSNNITQVEISPNKAENLEQSCKNETCNGEEQGKQGSIAPQITQSPSNSSVTSSNSTKVEAQSGERAVKGKVEASDIAASLSKSSGNRTGNGAVSGDGGKQGSEGNDLVGSLVNCDLYDGNWVMDNSYPLYKPGSCSFIDEQFMCLANGRPDSDYQKLKWKPKGCSLPRLNGLHMLELLRGKRLVFVGDSLNRNMWESLICILRNSVKNKKKVYEKFGRHHFRSEASYAFVFEDYDCTIEFFVAPFLVRQWEVQDKNGTTTKETLRLDMMVSEADQFKDADFLVFNTGHWWTHGKTSKGEDYYQEGSHVYKQLDVMEAFRRAITTWGIWVDKNVNPSKTHVLFRGYSASHFSGGQWNSGGQCDKETEPIRNETYLTPYPWKMEMFERVIKGMKTPVAYLNVTRMTDYRKDGHPSVFRKHHSGDLMVQDCSHWCLPGVPDLWNELLYAELLRKQYKDQQQQKNRT